MADIPERFQLRTIPVRPATEGELDEEAEWIYKQAFMVPPISQQNFQVILIFNFVIRNMPFNFEVDN